MYCYYREKVTLPTCKLFPAEYNEKHQSSLIMPCRSEKKKEKNSFYHINYLT